MELEQLKYNWEKMSQIDPFWAILTWKDKKGNKWKPDEFFATGQKEIERVLTSVKNSNIELSTQKALDFGCGVGRLTQALAQHFDEVYGVDISTSMIDLAHEYNRYGSKCKYFLNETDNLNLFKDNYFNLIYSNITLQHMEPIYSQKYIKEFLRVLSPQGLLIFQLPSELRNPNELLVRQKLKQITPPSWLNLYRKIRYKAFTEMYGIKQEQVIKLIQEFDNVEIVDIKPNQSAGNRWFSFQYWIRKV